MKTKKIFFISSILCFFLFISTSFPGFSKNITVNSPDENIVLKVDISEKISFSVLYKNKPVIGSSYINMSKDGKFLDPKIKNTRTRSVQDIIIPVISSKNSEINDVFNELTIRFQDQYALIFRVYNDGFAYRFQSFWLNEVTIDDEELLINFEDDFPVYFPKEVSFQSHNERSYQFKKLSSIQPGEFCSTPSLVYPEKGPRILITESDLQDYPGMWLKGNNGFSLQAIFPKAAKTTLIKNDRDVLVTSREPWLAKTKGTRSFPWRVFMMTENDGGLIESDLVFRLAAPRQLKDVSWIKPGKVAWDWWNDLNIYGVDFKSGINTNTYKYYIDFASKFGIEYIILDEGWYKLGDVMSVNPNINMEALIEYGNQKNVEIILWVVWKTLVDQLEEALNRFEKWGIAGIKVDFMQRDDQGMVNTYYKIAKEAAMHKLLVDFHGAYKPAGLRRIYPNVITREGVRGMEWNKWSDSITPGHDLTIPYIRMAAGPMDFTPGAMINAQKQNYHVSFSRPMSQGTRVHQMAMYVVYESPLQMLADNPSNYLKEPECTKFISTVPVTWNETRVFEGKVGQTILIARRKGREWYVAGMTNWTERDLEVDLSFLQTGSHTYEIFQDGTNANRYASDYKSLTGTTNNKTRLKIHLAKGGGWVAHFK